MGEVEPTALEIVAQALRNLQGKIELGCFGKSLPQTGVVCRRLLADRAHHWNKLASEVAEQFANRRSGHTLVRIVDVRIGDMFVGRKVGGIFSAKVQCPFEIRHHGREVVRRPHPRPCVVGGGGMRGRARDMVRRYLDLLLIFALCDTDQARVIGIIRQPLAIVRQCVD